MIFMKNKILRIILVFFISVLNSLPAYGIPSISRSSYSKQKEIQLNDSRLKYGEIENKVKAIQSKIYDLNVQIEPLQITAEKNKLEIEHNNLIIENTKKEIEQYKNQINQLDIELGQRAKAIYMSGDLEFTYLSFVLEAKSISDIFTRLEIVNKIIDKDRSAIKRIYEKKEDLNVKIGLLQEKGEEINKFYKDVQTDLKQLEEKKKEEEILVKEAKMEKGDFDLEYLSELEREAVSFQFNIIDNSESSLEMIRGAIKQLISIRDNQIKSEIVNKEVNEKIEKAKVLLEQKKLEEEDISEGKEKARHKKSNTLTQLGQGAFVGRVQEILNEAYKHIGKNYVWGATGVESFDCSGFTQYVYEHAAGMDISRTTYSQINIGKEVKEEELQPGDLVFPHPGHVGIYVGNGQMIHAPHTGDVIKVGPIGNFYAGRRIL